MWSSFQTRAPGKWVLAGEHSVLRGQPAVALPHPDFRLTLTFQPQVWDGLSIFPPEADRVITGLVQSIEQTCQKSQSYFPEPRGSFHIESSIPVGSGLGSSAALCVGMTRWAASVLEMSELEQIEFARALENQFHGQSSGMDVSVVSQECPIVFSMTQGGRPIRVKQLPRFTFHDTRQTAKTKDCVQQVCAFLGKNPSKGRALDLQMGEAAALGHRGLIEFDEGAIDRGLASVTQAMNSAHDCFEHWGLITSIAKAQRDQLLQDGALAVKLTGAGLGGYLVALWR